MNKVIRIIEDMNEEELEMLKKEIETGKVERMIKNRLEERQSADFNKICPVCHSKVGNDNLTIIFGPEGLRKKASFCALDCLEYFLNKIKDDKRTGGDL